MTEPYSYSNHLKEIVWTDLKDCGFKKKGTRFLRETKEERIDEIYFQRSQFNNQGFALKFYLNLYSHVHTKDGIITTDIRLRYPSSLIIPTYYKEFIASPLEGRQERFNQFSEEQKERIYNYVNSLEWTYSSELELIDKLRTAKNEITTKGFEFFDEIPKLMHITNRTIRSNIMYERFYKV